LIPVLILTCFLALLSTGRAASQVTPPRYHIVVPSVADRPAKAAEHLVFNAKRSTTFLKELKSFLSALPESKASSERDPYARLVETFSDAASREGVAATTSGNLVDLAYDWIDRAHWKYFVRLEVDFDRFEALFDSAKQDSLYRDLTVADLIYGGQGILDFKRNVPDYIDQVHEQQAFQTAKFEPRNKKQVRWAYRLAAQQVDVQLARYRTALAYLHSRGIDANMLQQKAEAEPRPQLKAILLHYAELLRYETERMERGDAFRLRVAILFSDVEREFPDIVTAVLRIGEKNKQVVFDRKTSAFDADPAAFRFLTGALD
jgi:hypothetical protein